ncbi:MAG: 2-amino-4-hydroxy-6-hydroxymethyldihydropteridine diphosphokinase [Anaerolineae bacterium]|nr:2-amino-4-hydroxy-6-hydroxymethyldihydropteridine diphosphokinase [Anaerolineae bacterium]
MSERQLGKQHAVYIALGTNVGHRVANLRQALEQLPPQVEVLSVSRLYETEAAYVVDQAAFLNMAVKAQTELSPEALLIYLKQIEQALGRQKTKRYGPRSIDLDIIFYDDLVLETPTLQIPHPRMQERGFVLAPLSDIGPEVEHPKLGQTVAELFDQLPAEHGILKVKEWV